MRILFLGDVMGRAGRKAVAAALPDLRTELALDFIVVNAENATSGAGLSADHARALLDAGADCLTLGDHAFDQRDIIPLLDEEPRIIRPLNIARAAPGRGVGIFETKAGKRILVAQILGQVFMKQPYADPFSAIDNELNKYRLGSAVDAAIIDIHAEATSEKMAMGHWCDGRASLVVGTHTHVPTADTQILPKGCGLHSDAGMCGDYLSVIGMERDEPMRRFVTGMAKTRFTPASGEASLCGVLLETEKGKARSISAFRRGGRLLPTE